MRITTKESSESTAPGKPCPRPWPKMSSVLPVSSVSYVLLLVFCPFVLTCQSYPRGELGRDQVATPSPPRERSAPLQRTYVRGRQDGSPVDRQGLSCPSFAANTYSKLTVSWNYPVRLGNLLHFSRGPSALQSFTSQWDTPVNETKQNSSPNFEGILLILLWLCLNILYLVYSKFFKCWGI